MKQSSIIDIGSTPYRGLRPYLETDAEFFFGRRREVRQLMAAAFSNPLTVVYGPSGVGKSSVLNAGLLHEIRTRGDLLGMVYNSWSDGDAMSAIARELHALAVDSGAAVDVDSSPLRQFELIAESLQEQEAADGPMRAPIVIVLDQFEDYTKYHDRSPEFHDRFVGIVNSLAGSVSFVVSIREDNVTLLDQFKGEIPALFDNYLRISYLDRAQATEAVRGPLDKWLDLHPDMAMTTAGVADGSPLVDDDLIPDVLDDVSVGATSDHGPARGLAERDAGRIETAYLQLVMATLWENRRDGPMSLELYHRLGKARQISRNHVSGVLGELNDQERRLASLAIPHLVTASGLKLAQHAQDIAERVRRDAEDLAGVLARLEEGGRILRVLDPPDVAPALRRYEPYHDRIAEALVQWKDQFDASDPTERYRRRLRNQVAVAVANANDRDDQVKMRGIEQLGRLATQLVDRQIADQAADELRKILEGAKGPLGAVVPPKKSYEKASEILKSRDDVLVNQIVGDIQGALSSIEESLYAVDVGVAEDWAAAETTEVDDDARARRADQIRDTPTWVAGPLGRSGVDPAAIQGDIEDIASLTAEHLENSGKGGSLGEIGTKVLTDLGSFSSFQIDMLVERLRSLGLTAQAKQLETAGEQWVRPGADIDFAIDTMPRWIRYVALTVGALVGIVAGVAVSAWWLERSGLPSPSDLAWPLAVYLLASVGEGWILAEETFPGETFRNAIVWLFLVAVGWIAVTSVSLMVNVTFGVGLFWPLWILVVAATLVGLMLAFVTAEF